MKTVSYDEKKKEVSVKPIAIVPKLIEMTVDFNKMQLKAVNEIVDDEWLPEKFRFHLAKKAIHRNMNMLKADKRRDSMRMIPAPGNVRGQNVLQNSQIKFTSSEDVLLYVGNDVSQDVSRVEFNQEGCSKTTMLKYQNSFGNEYFFIKKGKEASLDFTINDSGGYYSRCYEFENVSTDDFQIIFQSNTIKINHIDLSFCLVTDYSENLDSKKKDSGFMSLSEIHKNQLCMFHFFRISVSTKWRGRGFTKFWSLQFWIRKSI